MNKEEVDKYAHLLTSMSVDYQRGGIDAETYLQNLGFAVKALGAIPYDSQADTLKHIKRVSELLTEASIELIRRANRHDDSKLQEPEKSLFDEMTPKLAGSTYGSDDYKEFLQQLKPALDHHYKENSHHPEHYQNGVNDMNLFDVIEMFFDWKAATERHNDGDLQKSIEINKGRFEMSEQLVSIFHNTADHLGYYK